MRIQASTTIALATLLASLCGACQPDKSSTINVGTNTVTVQPQAIPGATVGVSNWTGNIFSFGGNLDATAGAFEIQTVDGWYELEATTQVKLVIDGGVEVLTLTDSTGAPVTLASKTRASSTRFEQGQVEAALLKTNKQTGVKTYGVTVKLQNSIHQLTVRSKS